MPVDTEDEIFLNDREPENIEVIDSVKQVITRPSFNLTGPLKSLWAYVAAADPPVSRFQSQELKPSIKESLFSTVPVCSVRLHVFPQINPGDWGVEYAD